MRTTFIENQKEISFANDGYLVVELLDPVKLKELNKAVRELGFGREHEEKLRVSITQESAEKKKEIYEKLSPVLRSVTDKLFLDYKLIRIGIFDKLPGGRETTIHNHPNLVDESKYRSLTFWVPLTDTSVEMGTLHVIKGSHKITNHIRPYNDFYGTYKKVSTRLLKKYSTPILLKAGQAIVFDDRLIHWTPPNNSSRIRTAIKVDFIPQEAELAIYFRSNDRELLKYTIEENCFRDASLTQNIPDNLQLLEKLNQQRIRFDNKQFISMMQCARPDDKSFKINIFQRFFYS